MEILTGGDYHGKSDSIRYGCCKTEEETQDEEEIRRFIMQHLNRKHCECGHELSAHDKVGKLEPNTQKGFFGGNVKAFAEAVCPECGKTYTLWLRQACNTWEVVTIAPRGWEVEQPAEPKKRKPKADQ